MRSRKTILAAAALVAAMGGGVGTVCRAQEPDRLEEPAAEILAPARQEPVAVRDERVGPHYQVGFHGRLAASADQRDSEPYLVTADLSWLRWSRDRSGLGAGIHFAADEDGHRLGLKGLWRTPLRAGSWSYFQVAPGVYLSGTGDTYGFRSPSFFFETELGLSRHFALALTAEVVRYEGRYAGFEQIDHWNYRSIYQDGTATNVYAGGKLGQGFALGASVIGLVIGAAIAASFANSGGMFGP